MVLRHDLSQYTGQQSSNEWPPKSPDIMLLDMLLLGDVRWSQHAMTPEHKRIE